jgi:hypothetical protein
MGLTTPPQPKNIVAKSEEVKTGPVCRGGIAKKVALSGDEWAKLLKKAGAHQGLSSH